MSTHISRKRDLSSQDEAGDAGARNAAISRVLKLRRVQASATPFEARCAVRAIAELVARHALEKDELDAAAEEDERKPGHDWQSERHLQERPPQEFLLAELRARGRKLKNAAGTSAGEELGLVFGAEKAAHCLLVQYVNAHRPHTRFDLASRECAACSVDDLPGGADAVSKLLLGRPACGRTDVGGELSAAVASVYRGTTVRSPEVLPVPPEAALTLTLRALLSAGDLVVCQWPTSPLVYDVLNSVGCRTLMWRPEATDAGGWQYSMATFEAILSSSSPAVDPAAVLLSLPSEPIGWLPDAETFVAVLDACRRRGSYVIADETYAPLTWKRDGELPAVAEVYELGVSVCSLSGAFGLSALRCGWVVCSNHALLKRIAELNSFHVDGSLCSPSDALALVALQPATWRALLERNQTVLAANRTKLTEFMRRHSDVFAFALPRAGTTAFVQLIGERALSSAEFCRRLVSAFGVLLLPDVTYQARNQQARAFAGLLASLGSWLSISFGGTHFEQALDVLDGALQRLGHTLGVMDVWTPAERGG